MCPKMSSAYTFEWCLRAWMLASVCACVRSIVSMLLTCQNLSGRAWIANQYPQTRHHSFNHQVFFGQFGVVSFQWALAHLRDQVDHTCMREKSVLVNLSNMRTLLHFFLTCARNILSPVDMLILLEHTFRRNGGLQDKRYASFSEVSFRLCLTAWWKWPCWTVKMPATCPCWADRTSTSPTRRYIAGSWRISKRPCSSMQTL